MRQRDIDALRRGITEQVRDDERREASERVLRSLAAREYVEKVRVVNAERLLPGDVLVATLDGYAFYRAARVTSVSDTKDGACVRDGHVWVEYTEHLTPWHDRRGSGGSSLSKDANVLIENV